MNKTLVVSRYKESLLWLSDVPCEWDIHVMNKDDEYEFMPYVVFSNMLPNVGREANSMLLFIRTYWNELPDIIAFCQGDPLPHDPEFIEHLSDDSVDVYGGIDSCNADGLPSCDFCKIKEYSAVLSLPVLDTYYFVAGAQFKVTKEQILSRSLVFYNSMHEMTTIDPTAAFTFERLWPVIFGLKI